MEPRDRVDDHVDRWLPVLPDLDPDVEGAVTRMQYLTAHLRRTKERTLQGLAVPPHEFETLHALAGRGGRATPSQLASDLGMPANSVTGRLDALSRRDHIRRTPSPADRRRVDVELTDAGRETWRKAMNALGHEEERLLGALTPEERRQLSGLLRRVLLRADAT
ncbi:MarR family winged helix-turn-helix transcriptional regulator [Actinomadura kijaniata]|uniref:MarR family winged helix-turn-helix transcriptional regulator n=1 Tax=Actinomadura kijaniata TaxID=46161 RepID=UPI00082E3663|nr:MarR family transcriptional regulator [Actinomadura kijaniata]